MFVWYAFGVILALLLFVFSVWLQYAASVSPIWNLYYYTESAPVYRHFISYLEGKGKNLSEILPTNLFSERMLEFAATIGTACHAENRKL